MTRSVISQLSLLSLLALPVAAATVESGTTARATVGGFEISTAGNAATLTVTGPDGIAWRGEFSGVGAFGAEQLGRPLPDGLYRWESVSAGEPRLRGAEDSADKALGSTEGGVFRVVNGAVVLPDHDAVERANKDQVIPDDLIVQGSICAGFDCVNNESFGFDTIRMKENNTRVKFEDTSVGNFPSTDWQLTANDSASGGANKFSIEDITGSKVPFTVTAGAATNSLFVDSTGRVGFRTSTPVLDLHVNTSNTPGIRLEQNNSGGFTAQTWDIAGNEANFFVRDVTGGSRLSFRIRPGAPTSSIDIASDGDVGIGTASPAQKLDVVGGNARISRTDGATTNTTSLFLENTGGAVASSWILRANGATGGFTFTEAGGNTSFRINTGALTNAITVTSTGVDLLGTLRVGGIVMNVPDYVFDESYDLLPIPEQGRFMSEQRHLPAVPAEQLGADGKPVVDLIATQLGMLEELEKAHLYIQQLHRELTTVRAEVAALSLTRTE